MSEKSKKLCFVCVCTLSAVAVLINPDGLIFISRGVDILYLGKRIRFWAWELDGSDTDSFFQTFFFLFLDLFSF